MKVLVLGVTGMLGSTVFRRLHDTGTHEVTATMRDGRRRRFFTPAQQDAIVDGVDVLDEAALADVWSRAQPDVVINCVGVIKQLPEASDPLRAMPINAELPHHLARKAEATGARLIHFSTDCVFSGKSGHYLETDRADADDLYGKSKYLGEVRDSGNALTLRTSIIGHELDSHHSLVDWFLSQTGSVPGYRRAIFSGLPAVELARVILEYVFPHRELRGLYHVSAAPIAKYELLKLIAAEYGKAIEIVPDDQEIIDRSLVSDRFRRETGYSPPSWPRLVHDMRVERDRYLAHG